MTFWTYNAEQFDELFPASGQTLSEVSNRANLRTEKGGKSYKNVAGFLHEELTHMRTDCISIRLGFFKENQNLLQCVFILVGFLFVFSLAVLSFDFGIFFRERQLFFKLQRTSTPWPSTEGSETSKCSSDCSKVGFASWKTGQQKTRTRTI